MTFSRADTPPTYAAPSAVHYWSNEKHLSSENLFLQSSDFDTTWFSQGLTSRTGGQTDPSGGTDGFTLLEDSAATFHRISQDVTAAGELALTVYAKRNAGSRYLNLTITTSASSTNAGLATFDLAGGATHTSNGASSTLTNLSATQTASGNGYYKCVFKATASAAVAANISLSDVATPASNNYGLVYYTGDGTSSIDIAFASLSTTGATDYNATTTQIHRAYAPTLKSVTTAGQPRFEYDPATDGQSMGILIEGQSQNLFAYSDDFANQWTKTRTLASESAAVGPTGALDADLIYADGTAADSHFLYSSCTVTAASHTFSVYAKFAGVQYIQLQHRVTGAGSAQFDLVNGTYVAYNATGAMEPVGNGWYRCSVTETQSAGTAFARIWLMGGSGVGDYNWDGDSYSGVLLYGAQYEQNSFPSSLISSNGSATTRAAEQLSVATADIGYTGGPFTIVSETAGGQGYYPRAFTLTNGNLSNRVVVYRDSSSASGSTNWLAYCESDGSFQGALTIPSSASAGKLAVSYNTNDVSVCASGGTVATDSSAVISDALTTLRIGTNYIGAEQLNGHCKRIAIYNEALSDSNLQAVTS